MSGIRLGQRRGISVPILRRVPGRPRQHELVRLTTRLVVAQAGVAAAVGLLFSRRQAWTIAMTLVLVAALCFLAAVARTGTPAARNVVLSFEVFLVVIGLYRFFFARYVGGTLFAIVITAILMHPSVARAYGFLPRRDRAGAEAAPGDGRGALAGPGAVTCSDQGADR